jgi:Heterokaryon incompatibility protein (HET)
MTRSWRDDKLPESQGEPVNVWIDTMCCPFNQGEGKQLALSRMKEIYTNATFTVVFDNNVLPGFSSHPG